MRTSSSPGEADLSFMSISGLLQSLPGDCFAGIAAALAQFGCMVKQPAMLLEGEIVGHTGQIIGNPSLFRGGIEILDIMRPMTSHQVWTLRCRRKTDPLPLALHFREFA